MSHILFIGAHTDDIELGAGGTISRYLSEGNSVYCIVFSMSNPDHPEWELEKEFSNSMKALGVKKYALLNFPMRHLYVHQGRVLNVMFTIKQRINPNMVFIPSVNDIHIDHRTIGIEATRAFKDVTTFGYELPWNNIKFQTHAFIGLTLYDMENKIMAISCYESQQNKSYMNPEFVKSLAITRGVQIGMQYAEAFEVIRWVSPV